MPSQIFYDLRPSAEWEAFRKDVPRPAQKRDSSGNLMWERHPRAGETARAIYDFPILANLDHVCLSFSRAIEHTNKQSYRSTSTPNGIY